MDNEAFREDLEKAVRKLPKELLTTLAAIAKNHMAELTRVLPEIVNDMRNHIQAGMVEAAMGTLDKAGLEATVRGVFLSFGVDPDFETPTVPNVAVPQVTPVGNMNDLLSKVE
jgi:hypothetical protein